MRRDDNTSAQRTKTNRQHVPPTTNVQTEPRHCAAALPPAARRCFPKQYLEDQRPNWHHSQPGERVHRIGTVPAMSAWKTAARPPGPGQGSRLRRDRQCRQPGLDWVSAGPAFWLPRACGSCERGAPRITRRRIPAGQLSDGDRKRSWQNGVDANDPSQTFATELPASAFSPLRTWAMSQGRLPPVS